MNAYINLSSLLKNIKDYLNNDPADHNHQTHTFDYLKALAGACSAQDQNEATLLKNFVSTEIKPIIACYAETDFGLEEINEVENILDIVIQENEHSDYLLETRKPGKLEKILNALGDNLEQLKVGIVIPT